MGSKTVYNAPKIEKDDTFEKYLADQKERELKLEEQAQKEKEEAAAAEKIRREGGAAGLTGMFQRTKDQLGSGLINYQQAQDQLKGNIDKYDLTSLPSLKDTSRDDQYKAMQLGQTLGKGVFDAAGYLDRYSDLKETFGDDTEKARQHYLDYGYKEGRDPGLTGKSSYYTDPSKGASQYLDKLADYYQGEGGLQSERRTAGIQLAYQDLLGREATSEELSQGMKNLKLQAYGGSGIQGLRDSLKSGSEYTKKFNDNYLDNYYDTMYGEQTVDEEGNKTKKRTFTFDASLLPSFQTDLAERTGVNYTTGQQFADYFGTGKTIAELEAGQQNIRDTRKFLFSAGLTNLQGEIDKETQKIKNEGAKDIAKIQQATNMYTGLLGGFNF